MQITKPLINCMLLSATLLTGQAFIADPFDPEFQPLGYIGPSYSLY
ncbi:MAG: hypothetical protein GY875_07840 [Gammaproteobacteria bacterium]|nr:hypothetical protein [Gammaproteobacteria bacterium]